MESGRVLVVVLVAALALAQMATALKSDKDLELVQDLELEEGACAGNDETCIPSSRRGSCQAMTTCHSCTVLPGCGWCASTKGCMYGGLAGPVGSNCTFWDYSFCSGEPCDAYTNCYQCITDPFCGWCSDEARCMEGMATGPLMHECVQWEHNSCAIEREDFLQDEADPGPPCEPIFQ